MKTLEELKEELNFLENNPLWLNSDGMPSFSGAWPLNIWYVRWKRRKQIFKLKLQIQQIQNQNK